MPAHRGEAVTVAPDTYRGLIIEYSPRRPCRRRRKPSRGSSVSSCSHHIDGANALLAPNPVVLDRGLLDCSAGSRISFAHRRVAGPYVPVGQSKPFISRKVCRPKGMDWLHCRRHRAGSSTNDYGARLSRMMPDALLGRMVTLSPRNGERDAPQPSRGCRTGSSNTNAADVHPAGEGRSSGSHRSHILGGDLASRSLRGWREDRGWRSHRSQPGRGPAYALPARAGR